MRNGSLPECLNKTARFPRRSTAGEYRKQSERLVTVRRSVRIVGLAALVPCLSIDGINRTASRFRVTPSPPLSGNHERFYEAYQPHETDGQVPSLSEGLKAASDNWKSFPEPNEPFRRHNNRYANQTRDHRPQPLPTTLPHIADENPQHERTAIPRTIKTKLSRNSTRPNMPDPVCISETSTDRISLNAIQNCITTVVHKVFSSNNLRGNNGRQPEHITASQSSVN